MADTTTPMVVNVTQEVTSVVIVTETTVLVSSTPAVTEAVVVSYVVNHLHSADNIYDGTLNKVFTAAEQTKLGTIAEGAEVNVNADWDALSGDAQILNKPTTFVPSNHGNERHSSTFITGEEVPANETDPVFSASPSVGITAELIQDWNNAFSWGDHALVGYLTAETDPVFTAWDKSTGISITESQISDLRDYLTLDQTTPQSVINGAPIFDGVELKQGTGLTDSVARLIWNSTDETVNVKLNTDVTLQVGQETLIRGVNRNEATISNGQAVYIAGSQGQTPKFSPARADAEATGGTIGLATQDLVKNEYGFVTVRGLVRGIKTNYTGTGIWGTAWTEGDVLWVSKTNAGVLTNVEPDPPHHSTKVGVVTNISSNQGSILVQVSPHRTVSELSDVYTTDLADKDILQYINTNGRWEVKSLDEAIGYTPATSNHDHSGVYQPVMGTDDNYVTDTEKSNLHAPGSDNQDLSALLDETAHDLLDHAGLTGIHASGSDNQDLNSVLTLGATSALVPTLSNGIITNKIYPSVDAVTAFQFQKADTTTPVMTIDTSNARVGINTAAPAYALDITGTASATYMNVVGGGGYFFGGIGGTYISGYDAASGIVLVTNSANRLRVLQTGHVGIGLDSPTAYLHLKAGTATASTSPLKFTSGVNNTIPEAGAMEYDGTQLYFSPSTTRNILAQVSGGTALTTGSIPFATTSGYFTQDNSNLFWDNSTKRLGIGTASPTVGLELGTTTVGLSQLINATRTNLMANPMTSGGWTLTPDITISGGVMTKIAGASTRTATCVSDMSAAPTIGYMYMVIFDTASITGSFSFSLAGRTSISVTTTGTVTFLIEATSTAKMVISAVAATAFVVNSIQVLELTNGRLTVDNSLYVKKIINPIDATQYIAFSDLYMRFVGTTYFTGVVTTSSSLAVGTSITCTNLTPSGYILLGVATVSTAVYGLDSLRLSTTAATSNATGVPYQYSGGLLYMGSGWDIDGAVAVTQAFRNELVPYAGNTVTSRLRWQYGSGQTVGVGMHGTGYYDYMALTSEGELIILGSTFGSETLTNGAFTSGTGWTGTLGFSLASNTAVYLHNASGGTLTQASASLATPLKANRWYRLTYTTSAINTTARCYISETYTSEKRVYLDGTLLAGTYCVYFKANSSPTDFVLVADSNATGDGFTLDDMSLMEVQSGNLVPHGLITGGGTTGIKVDNAGSVGIGVTAPTAKLHLPAGTATASTAPLKFTSGVVNTIPEAGAIEYDGTDFFLNV